MNLLIIIMTDLLVLKLGVSVPLLLDDQEEDTGGDTEDDGEHCDDGGEDDVVQHGGVGPAVPHHLRQHWIKMRDNFDILLRAGHTPDSVLTSH